ncbi:hypothetical protein [Rhodopila sp.]|uniref:hypothetical protein n=1 Tax=Rhodopila sp. TaxID=2480087 RepID=UPI003D0A110C
MTQTTSYAFGAGDVFLTSAGNAPALVGTLQDVEIDISASTQMLYGQNQFAELVARGEGKITGKAKTGKIDLGLISTLYSGQSPDLTGYEKLVKLEAHTIPASSSYIVTASHITGGITDQGVYYAAGGQLTPVTAGSEATGKYSVNLTTGVYTFAAGDEGVAIFLNYTYVATTGSQMLVTNQAMGVNPVFQLFMQQGATAVAGRQNVTMRLYA